MLKKLFNLFKKKIIKSKVILDNNELNILYQEHEDFKYLQDARRIALEDYENYNKEELEWNYRFNFKPPFSYCGIIVSRPRRFIYTIYNHDTAKYKQTKFSDLVKEEYIKLRNNDN